MRVILLLVFFFLFSCSSIQKQLYSANKYKFFNTKEEAVDNYKKKNKLDPNRIYFFETENDRTRFIEDVDSKRTNLIYYKTMLNDSIQVDDSSIVDKTCIGSIEEFVSGYNNQYPTLYESDINSFTLKNYQGEVLDFNLGMPTVVFVIDNNLGKLINVSANFITNKINSEKLSFNYVYISTDAIMSQFNYTEKAKQ